MKNSIRIKTNNRGAAMINVLFIVTFAAILISALFWLTSVAFKTKTQKAAYEKAFYQTSSVAEVIRAGIAEDVMSTSSLAGYFDSYISQSKGIIHEGEHYLYITAITPFVAEYINPEDTSQYTNTSPGVVVSGRYYVNETPALKMTKIGDEVLLEGLLLTNINADGVTVSSIETDIKINHISNALPSQVTQFVNYRAF